MEEIKNISVTAELKQEEAPKKAPKKKLTESQKEINALNTKIAELEEHIKKQDDYIDAVLAANNNLVNDNNSLLHVLERCQSDLQITSIALNNALGDINNTLNYFKKSKGGNNNG